jgi:hypothetical protein
VPGAKDQSQPQIKGTTDESGANCHAKTPRNLHWEYIGQTS